LVKKAREDDIANTFTLSVCNEFSTREIKKLDKFATAAMQAFISVHLASSPKTKVKPVDYRLCAERAYDMAEAMLKESNDRG
jgi:hypothetical protein